MIRRVILVSTFFTNRIRFSILRLDGLNNFKLFNFFFFDSKDSSHKINCEAPVATKGRLWILEGFIVVRVDMQGDYGRTNYRRRNTNFNMLLI